MATARVDQVSEPLPSQPPDPGQFLMQLSTGYMIAAALYPITKLQIAELLADGPQPISKLAQSTGANEDGLYRVMRALANVGVFSEVSPRTFALSPAASPLRCDVAGSMRDLVLWMTNDFHFRVWGQMMHSVMTGKPSVEAVYGKPVFDLFPELPETNVEFNNAMTNISATTIPVILEHYDFSGIGTLVDVAGGHGLLISQILKHYPEMNGVLIDLPHVLEGAKKRIERLGLSQRLQTQPCNFFDSVPACGDVYVMQHIIHDWDDEKSLTILKNTRKALDGKKNGKLIILDSLINTDGGMDFAKWKDLEMLTLPGGRERTEEEFRMLLNQSGFKLTRTIPLPAMVSIVEAVPA
jgi:O-methyltransferase domain